MKRHKLLLVFLMFVLTATFSCQSNEYSPKPRGYHRIFFPEKNFIKNDVVGCPFVLEIPSYGMLEDDMSTNSNNCWKNINFVQFNAKLHLSYFDVGRNSTFEQLTEDARTFVFKHASKATAIDQKVIAYPAHNVYGLEYEIKGNTASNYQFYISDSSSRYLRGALYFSELPNLDSIQPVLEFLKKDIKHMVSTVRWK